MAFNSWGYVNSLGIFQAYYETTLNQPPSAISWIGCIQIFLTLFIGTFSGRALDAGYYIQIVSTGLGLQILGIFMTSIVKKYWQLLLGLRREFSIIYEFIQSIYKWTSLFINGLDYL